MFNIMYADNKDTIFYINNALMPIRNTDRKYDWKNVVAGNTSQTLWSDFKSIKVAPQYVNPSSGFLFNTNHSSFFATAEKDNLKENNFAWEDGWETLHNNRSKRFLEIMPMDKKINMDKFKSIKYDMTLPKEFAYAYNIDSVFNLNEKEFPQYATIIQTFKNWDRSGSVNSKGGAMFLLAYLYLQKKLKWQQPRYITKVEAIETLQYINDYLTSNFGKTDIVLGDLQKLVRGGKDWPLGGFPDLLAPQWTAPYKNGMVKSIGGDAYIMFIRFPKNGMPIIETINTYGASAHKESKHFDDQVEMYLNHQTKKMTLNKEQVLLHAERIYHPGE
jgi:acyl-homoserine-lactone acylase